MTDKTKEELLTEIYDLKTRLRDSEENLNAIRTGGVDALVISGPQGEQVFTLNEADRPYRIIIEEMNEGTITTDEEGVILYSNKQFSKMLGIPLSKIMGSSLYEHIVPEHHPTILGFISCDHRDTRRAEIIFRGTEKQDIWTNISVSPLKIDQTLVFCIIISDITSQKHAEEEQQHLEMLLRQAQKMEAIGRFASGIAHDMNNLLYPVLLNTQMVLEECQPGSSIHQSLEQSLNAIYRQKDLIKQLLSFSRKGEQQLGPMRIKPIIKETIAMLKSLIPSTIRIKQSMEGYHDVVMGNPTQIQQIIMNLCKNAADAMPSQKGRVEVTLGNIHLDKGQVHPDLKAGDYLSLAVKDTGIGMTPEIISHIFEPFFTTKESGKGIGMGLAIINGIVKAHAGAITVESEPEKGTKITVYLPLLSQESLALETHDVSEHQLNCKGRILLIDDEEIILKSVQKVLKTLGYDVVTGRNGREALDVFSTMSDGFDLVITDVAMPGMTGMELAEELVKIRSDIQIILCTGLSDDINGQKMKDLGICGVLEKPADINEVKKAINRALKTNKDMVA